ncbi:hypothetical protein [Nocardia alni]|uniref:hypothetical protein n=1 Tax=Nocardia alni TaxID=2815723 RepID=UPI001C215F85|nr:hypothetical protein [Nocardia alni]
MGFRERRLRRSMRDPVRGEFRPTGSYFPHPGRVPMQEMLTGVVTGPGVGPVAGEAMNDLRHGRAIGREVLPVLVDRADPTKMLVLWGELPAYDSRAEARQQAQHAAEQAQRATAKDRESAEQARSTVDAPADWARTTTDAPPDWARTLIADLVDRGVMPGGHIADITTTIEYGSGSRETWQPATAVLRGITEVPLPAEFLPGPTATMCMLTLDVSPPGAEPYTVQVRQGFRSAERRAQIAVIGATLPVLIDPGNSRNVVLRIP